MTRVLMVLLILITISFSVLSIIKDKNNVPKPDYNLVYSFPVNNYKLIYDSIHLDRKGLSFDAFNYAIEKYDELKRDGKLHNDSILTVVDFDQPSFMKRMYVIDIKNYKMLYNTWTAHGKNSGEADARFFSNSPQSNKSSLGLYLTDKAYSGKNGYSLKLIGLEKTNSNALQRAIVVHGAWYVSQRLINESGYIGRSNGCPAIPEELSRPIINKIKGGSCFFIFSSLYKHS